MVGAVILNANFAVVLLFLVLLNVMAVLTLVVTKTQVIYKKRFDLSRLQSLIGGALAVVSHL